MSTEQQNSYDATYPSIIDVISRELDNLVLLYGTSNNDVIKAIGFKVVRTARRIQNVTNGPTLDADGGANDTIGFGYFGENGHSQDVSDPGDEVFSIDSQRNETIVEYGFSVTPDGIDTAIADGENYPILGLREGSNRRRGYGPSDFADFGAVPSARTNVNSPDDLPTTALSGTPRQGIIKIDSKQDGTNPVRFAFSNTTNSQETVSVTAVGQTYEVTTVTNPDDVRSMVNPGGIPARKLTYGAFPASNPNLPREWYQDTVDMQVSDLQIEG